MNVVNAQIPIFHETKRDAFEALGQHLEKYVDLTEITQVQTSVLDSWHELKAREHPSLGRVASCAFLNGFLQTGRSDGLSYLNSSEYRKLSSGIANHKPAALFIDFFVQGHLVGLGIGMAGIDTEPLRSIYPQLAGRRVIDVNLPD